MTWGQGQTSSQAQLEAKDEPSQQQMASLWSRLSFLSWRWPIRSGCGDQPQSAWILQQQMTANTQSLCLVERSQPERGQLFILLLILFLASQFSFFCSITLVLRAHHSHMAALKGQKSADRIHRRILAVITWFYVPWFSLPFSLPFFAFSTIAKQTDTQVN